ncbi:MAG TPA: SpoIIE family protein phosphatase, partial [Actinomycetota bacterium]|nr:SpoIIE family protein phosphatase [Actinomycetota bacterium]
AILKADGSVTTVAASVRPADTPSGRFFVSYLRDVAPTRAAKDEMLRLIRDRELLLNAAGEGIIRVDVDGRVTFVNPAAEELLGWERGGLIDRPVHETIHHSAPDGSPYPAEECPINEAARDGSVHRIESEVFWRKDATSVAVEYISAPLWEDGRLAGSVVTFRDVTERRAIEAEVRRARDVFRLLARISSVLGETPLDPDQRLRVLAREFVPMLVDWCAIDLLDNGGLRRVVVEHVDPRKVALAHELQRRYPPDPASEVGAWAVMRTGRPQIFEHVPDEMLEAVARDDEHLDILRSLGLDSVVVVPMTARDRVLGVITLVTAESGRRLNEDDAILYSEVAARAGILIDNARLFTERSRVAQVLQQSLLPPVLPVIEGVDVAARYVSATNGIDVGGDFYDIFQTDPGDWAVVLGDVSGKGAEAAAMTALARYTIRAAAISARKPSAVLTTLNRAIVQQDTGRFCTACYIRVRPSPTGVRLAIARGGHPRPLVLRAGGRLEEAAGEGMVLGLFEDPDLGDRTARLKPGDSLILFTDGVTEARGQRGLLGERTLRAFLRSMTGKSAEEIAAGIEHLALEWQDGDPRDDVAVVVLQAPRRPA